MTSREPERARRLLCRLQDHIRGTLLAAYAKQAGSFARVAAVTAADTIYHVDRLSEEAILDWLASHWPTSWPLELVMEGLEDRGPVTFPAGTPVARTVWKCIIDPIDGTRNLMYDKRSAWILSALAPQRGARTHLGDIVVAAMTELPTSKQWRSDQFSAVRGGGVKAVAVNVLTGARRSLRPAPSRERHCRGGFASIVKFFPEGKRLTAKIEELLWERLYGLNAQASPQVFDDQYISTGGQLYELIAGHDRFIADLRPLVFAKIGFTAPLVCHPYDICTALIAREAGCIVTGAGGRQLRQPLDTTSPVAWVGYANASLARRIGPVLRRILRELPA